VSLAEAVADVQAGHHRGEPPARLVHGQELGERVAQRLRVFVLGAECDLDQRVAQHADGDRVASAW
jgi:hypothetical protein